MPHRPRSRVLGACLGLVLGPACGCPSSNAPDPGASSPPAPADVEVERLPMERTTVDALNTDQLAHYELLMIHRDFGKPDTSIVLDAWVTRAAPPRLADARLWWVMTDRENKRGPFGPNTRRHFQIDYEQPAPDRWIFNLTADEKRFTFYIELDEEGHAAAFANVLTDDGRVEHCRAQTGKLTGRKILGLVVGVEGLTVSCTDAAGTTHEGLVESGSAS